MFPYSYREQKPKETQMEDDMSLGWELGCGFILLCFHCGPRFSGRSDLFGSDVVTAELLL